MWYIVLYSPYTAAYKSRRAARLCKVSTTLCITWFRTQPPLSFTTCILNYSIEIGRITEKESFVAHIWLNLLTCSNRSLSDRWFNFNFNFNSISISISISNSNFSFSFGVSVDFNYNLNFNLKFMRHDKLW